MAPRRGSPHQGMGGVYGARLWWSAVVDGLRRGVKMDVPLILLLLCLTVAVALPASAAEASLTAWAVDPLEKVFPDATPPAEPGVVSLRAARGRDGRWADRPAGAREAARAT